MKRKKLETGMAVLLVDGDVGIIINDTIVFECNYLRVKDYNKDLTFNNNYKFDIIKVSSVLKGYDFIEIKKGHGATTINHNLLWEREV